MYFSAIIGAWITAIVTALPALWLYSVSDPSLQGISICMFGNIGQGWVNRFHMLPHLMLTGVVRCSKIHQMVPHRILTSLVLILRV